MPREGGTPRRLTNTNAIDTEAVHAPTAASSTSSAMVAAARRSTATPTAAARRASPSAGRTTSAQRSAPTAKSLAYVTRRQGGAYRLALLDLEGGNAAPRLITDTSDDENPSFAPPNGRLIVYTRARTGATG